MNLRLRCLRAAIPWLLGCSALGAGPAAGIGPEPLGELSLEDLVKLEVRTVSRKAQRLSDTAAAVTIVTADDIRRSGARSIPEALRLVPGVEVAQMGAASYAVSVRGFNGRFSNKLLVQVDGRSVYSAFFSGVFWETLDLMLEDIERIEVVRGPGAALWGANAVNGVINIVSRRASATQGALASVAIDDQGKPMAAARYGVNLAELGSLRLYAKGSELPPSRLPDGGRVSDEADGWRAGFRFDSAPALGQSVMLQGEAYHRRTHEIFVVPDLASRTVATPTDYVIAFDGAHLLGRLARPFGDGEMTLQAYVDTIKAELVGFGDGEMFTGDLDLQHRLAPIGAHELLWGVGYRYSRSRIDANGWALRIAPDSRRLRTASAFVQDEITLDPGKWKLTLGTKFEDASLSGSEWQPNARLLWTPTDVDTAWASWARAVRTPSVGEVDAELMTGLVPTPPLSLVPYVGLVSRALPGYRMSAERLDAAELGYRRNLGNGSLEAVAFVHDYDRLLASSTDTGGIVFPGRIRLPFPPYSLPDMFVNRGNLVAGRIAGLELAFDVPLTEGVRLGGAYSRVTVNMDSYTDPVIDATARRFEGLTPRHTFSLRLATTLSPGHEFDVMLRRVSGVQAGAVPAYTAVDIRYGWKVNRNLELSIVGQNLAEPRHLEFIANEFPSVPAYQARRGYIQGTWRF